MDLYRQPMIILVNTTDLRKVYAYRFNGEFFDTLIAERG